MTVYRVRHLSGKFDHVEGKKAAIARANELEGEAGLTEAELQDRGWIILRVSKTIARSVGFSI